MMTEVIVVLAKLISGANVRWVGCLPDARQRIYFANHTSNLDTVVLWAALPPDARAQTRPVAARDYWTAGKLRPYLAKKIFRAVLIERKKVTARDNPVEQMLAALEEKSSLIIFPEGGRQSGPEMAPFKSGLYHLAKKRADVEFIPVLIDNLNRILPKGEVLPVPVLSCISFGAPIRVEEKETKAAFLERAREAVNRLRQT
ncbi:MAG TPA: lysophospholipid acyltransferase family protein [Haliangiales bacterium]|nr:lysophospholipid acyltransferase family protein [Haliangiales bacterium]